MMILNLTSIPIIYIQFCRLFEIHQKPKKHLAYWVPFVIYMIQLFGYIKH